MKSKVLTHFRKVDPILAAAAEKVALVELKWRQSEDFFAALCGAIVGQQLSDKVAEVIYARLEKLGKGKLSPDIISKLSDQELRDTGVSWSKVKFIKNLAENVKSGAIELEKLTELEDKLVITELVKLHGIGPWTAEMFLMFSLGREDVFSPGDLGLKRAIQKLYGFKKEPTKQQLLKISSKWSPYRTYASLVLWKVMD